MDFYLKGDEEAETMLNRSLVQTTTLNVTYDSETKIIRITSPENSKTDVYIYDSNGTVVGYANSLNTTIQLISVGSYTIYIENDGWYGIGYVNAL